MDKKNKKKSAAVFTDKNMLIRIVSIFCAILLWFYVSEVESPTSEMNFDAVAITLRNKDVLLSQTDLSIVSDAIYEANITLSGKKSTLNKIDYEDIEATADLSKLTEAGTYELSVSVKSPSGTSVVSTNPKYITVTVDRTVAKSFNIQTDINYSNLPSSYELGEPVVSDAQAKVITTVTASGPASQIDRIDKIVARADLGALSSSVEARTNLIMLDSYGDRISDTDIKLSTPTVTLKQPVYITKSLPLAVSQATNTFNNYQISFKITPSAVKVKGDPKILEELEYLTLDPINERSIGEALTTTVNSLIKLPDTLELVGTQNTATITASVKNVKCQYFTVTKDDLKVINMPDSHEVEFEDFTWTLVLINASNKDLSSNDIDLTLDMKNYIGKGIYTLDFVPTLKDSPAYAYIPYGDYALTFEINEK